MFRKHTVKNGLIGVLFIGLAAVVLSTGGKVNANGTYFVLTPSTPFFQNWSNTGLITVDDNWTNVPSIIGYRGDDAAALEGVNPQTVLADYSAIIDVNANRSDPDTFATGGVTEFDGIPNPVVALKGSGTADFPHIDIRLNTTGCVGQAKISVSYNVRDLDGTATDAAQQTALHYRIGSSGSYTNIATGYVFDATNPGSATRVSPVLIGLPDDAKGVPQVHVRIMSSNSVGNDESVGIDDIAIQCLAPTAANVTLAGRVQTADGRGIRNATVVVSGNGMKDVRVAQTGSFGNYSFSDLTAGETYVVTVNSKRYTFTVPSRVINLVDEVTDADFIAEP